MVYHKVVSSDLIICDIYKWSPLEDLRINFKVMDVDSFNSLYKIFVRSHLEYAESVWNPHYMYLINDLEKVHKRDTKLLRQCKHLNYRQHLEFLNLPTLVFRRNRVDILDVFKILSDKHDPTLPSILRHNINSTTRATQWNCAHIVPSTIYANTTLQLGSLISGTASQVPTHVITAVSIDSFKNRLNKFWANEEARFDYMANLSGSSFARFF